MKRERTPPVNHALQDLLPLLFPELEEGVRILEPTVKRSHKAIRRRVQRFSSLSDKLSFARSSVSSIFIVETIMYIGVAEA